jgi:uncharacterized protein YbbC (DUF1343 family)
LKNQYQRLFQEYRHLIEKKRIGLFCNQVSFDFTEGKYLFQLLSDYSGSVSVLVPEHGLFAELQDQVPVENLSAYRDLDKKVSFVSFYINTPDKTDHIAESLDGIDTLIIDIQDIGVRYYTYLPMIAELFKVLIYNGLHLPVVVIDRPNPACRQVEGTILKDEYSSLIGLTGLPHRYGLTLGELCMFLRSQYNGDFQLQIINKEHDTMPVNPSPNIPGIHTCRVFSGQCLLEGTNLSEGRGTTRPFEIFGAPFLKDLPDDWVEIWNKKNTEAILRPIQFVPTFHKHKDQLCYGFQLHPGKKIHALLYSLKMLRSLKENLGEMRWLEGPYEAGSYKPAIELLVGDEDLIGYLNGMVKAETIQDMIDDQEKKWIEMAQPYLLYDEPLFQV